MIYIVMVNGSVIAAIECEDKAKRLKDNLRAQSVDARLTAINKLN